MSATTHGEDVVAVEVHSRALRNITNEMSSTLVRTSGSPVVTESKDYAACVLDTIPEHLSTAAYLVTHFGTSLVGTQRVAEIARGLDDLRPGDGFIVNDTYTGGANHQGDVGVIMPVFHEATHIGWGFTNMHLLDIGGAGVSGVAPASRDIYGEGLRFAGVRAIRGGAIDREWEDFIATNVRTPGPVLNDIRSMISGINVGARKLSELVAQIGLERHTRMCAIHKDLSEALLRERIAQLPDGVYEAYEWNEFDGHGVDHLLRIKVTMEVDGSDLRFAFEGAPQIDGFVNAGYGALLGSMYVAILTSLCYGDMPMNGGIWRPVTVDVGPPGTIVNPVAPAPVSMGHSEVGMRVRKMTRDVLSQAMALSDDPVIRGRISGKAHDGPAMGPILFGGNQHGGRSVIVYQDTALTGGGAASVQDGQDAYGSSGMTGSGMPDVETHEAMDPVVFLWRGVTKNSGGPGQTRGGQGVDMAYRLAYFDKMSGPSTLAALELPPSGVGGGYPGGAEVSWVLRGEEAERMLGHMGTPAAEEQLAALDPLPGKMGFIEIHRGDVVIVRGGGGGGLGDPLLRAPALVAEDVRGRYVTAAHAEAAYGVVLSVDGAVDADATAARRLAIRRDRLAGEAPARELATPATIGVAVIRTASGAWACGSCAEGLGAVGENFRDAAVAREAPIHERFAQLRMYVRARRSAPGVVLREHFCPSCAQALVVDVVADDTPVVRAPALAAGAPALA
ncbi:MAG TPA: hydantoinase B/oxoprolinase family protein [Baekduia sp.]|uniref:hydantoinase B/oxoprolinase family protein n=1 Tax=Baekduia sp. TaxID=2600305 RepID=UPI002D775480|nr:hydantoinase B/oxoprolinase family protein [Baekduia sp.]HET6509965.1 hydantoinase B/oxoprolinase family protein [Baekduia sp.]